MSETAAETEAVSAAITVLSPEVARGIIFRDLGAEIISINKSNGWNVTTPDAWPDGDRDKSYRLGSILMLIVSEAAEALEAVRHNDRANFEEELADTLIRVLDLSHGLGIDMDAVVAAKLAKNRTRGFRHGGKTI